MGYNHKAALKAVHDSNLNSAKAWKLDKRALVSESEMLSMLDGAKRVYLLEPVTKVSEKNRHIPLGLSKISTYVKARGGKIRYGKVYDGSPTDLICCGTIFTYDFTLVHSALKGLDKKIPVLMGGPFASLMPSVVNWIRPTAKIFKGYSKVLDQTIPDYDGENWEVGSRYVESTMTFTTRGCPNKCAYCAVPRIEKEPWINPIWKELIKLKPETIIFDNNLTSSPKAHWSEVLGYLVRSRKRNVLLENGIDCKHVDLETLKLIGKMAYRERGLRIAFDRIEEDGVFQTAVERLLRAGVRPNSIMAYVLFNFTDKPKDAHYRAKECQRLGILPYVQKYRPLNDLNRTHSYVGKYWTETLAKEFFQYWNYFAKRNSGKDLSFEEWSTWENYTHQGQLGVSDWEAWNA